MYSTDSATQTGLELTTQNRRIHRYILSTLREAEKNVDEYYINKYNPFYKWEIGNLRGTEIVEALSLFFEKDETSEKIKTSAATQKAFSQLVAFYKEKVDTKIPKSLSQKEWLNIRKHYEQKLKEEYERTLGTIILNEKITYGNGTNNSRSAGSFVSDDANDLDDEEIELKALENEIQGLLDNLQQGEWLVRMLFEKKLGHRIAILKSNLEKKFFEYAFSILRAKFPHLCFCLKTINDDYYIEGFLALKQQVGNQ